VLAFARPTDQTRISFGPEERVSQKLHDGEVESRLVAFSRTGDIQHAHPRLLDQTQQLENRVFVVTDLAEREMQAGIPGAHASSIAIRYPPRL
jgi:hypothetical protein